MTVEERASRVRRASLGRPNDFVEEVIAWLADLDARLAKVERGLADAEEVRNSQDRLDPTSTRIG